MWSGMDRRVPRAAGEKTETRAEESERDQPCDPPRHRVAFRRKDCAMPRPGHRSVLATGNSSNVPTSLPLHRCVPVAGENWLRQVLRGDRRVAAQQVALPASAVRLAHVGAGLAEGWRVFLIGALGYLDDVRSAPAKQDRGDILGDHDVVTRRRRGRWLAISVGTRGEHASPGPHSRPERARQAWHRARIVNRRRSERPPRAGYREVEPRTRRGGVR